jgi:hypothetical protein
MLEELLLKLKRRDIRIVQETAKVVLLIDGDEVEITRNYDNSLNVIAIIGRDCSTVYDSPALLAEVGLWRTKPFQPSQIGRAGRNNGGAGRRTCIPERGCHSKLTKDQYEIVTPVVFSEMQKLVNSRTNGWKRKSYWTRVPVIVQRSGRKFHYKRSSSVKLWYWWVSMEWPRGLRFSVCARSRFAQDVLWAELNLNNGIKQYLRIIANSFDSALSGYSAPSLNPKNFGKLKGFRLISEVMKIDKISWHLLIEALGCLPEQTHYRNQLARFIGWDGFDTKEKELSLAALPDPATRLGDIQIRTFGIKNGFLSFEVMPTT